MPIARCPLYYKFACAKKFETGAILARETVLHFMRHFSRCIPLGSWRIKGIEPCCTKWGDFGSPQNPIDQPYAVWIRTSISPLDHEQKGVPAPLYSQPLSERPTVRRLDTATSWRPEFSHPEPRRSEPSSSPRPHDQINAIWIAAGTWRFSSRTCTRTMRQLLAFVSPTKHIKCCRFYREEIT